ncbi:MULTISPECIES: DUF4183 domain-containing protein [unclassified Paenibacillus]|uniref:DUF4183 domain-containing protein n=1 Tax=unclassified Paenibacillus TaxID=185978 RepID=UPI0024B9A05B|nr:MULTISPECIES: DUF4183 domain-containing protein [unclassified Paenibacillus]
MALSIFNVVISAAVTSSRFFYTWPTTTPISPGLNTPATSFVDDTGTAATAFPTVPNGYYNFYINGVLQEQGTFSVSTSALTINTGSAGPISANTPFIIEAVNLAQL